jgi:mRNA interferase MazF
LVRMPGTPAGKARPCLIVQRESTLAESRKVTVCPFTSSVAGSKTGRPLVVPSSENGLRRPSEIEIDWVYTFRIDVVGETIGRLDANTMRMVDEALRRWLDL